MKKLYLKTYGCQMNVYDSGRIVDLLTPLGYTLTDTPEGADMALINTCHVREKAEQKMDSDLGRLRKVQEARRLSGADLVIGVTGCVAQAEGDEILRRAPYVSLVFGPQSYHRLPQMIAQLHRTADNRTGQGRGILEVDFPAESKFDFLPATQTTRASAFITVQEGCDQFCSYCVVPFTRGAEYSRPVAEILVEARHLVAQSAIEITLLGQNVNAYRGPSPTGQGTWGLGHLIQELAQIPGLKRLRYTTSHPAEMHEDLFIAHRDVPQLMPYLHLPVQSGSDRILKAMNRHHSIAAYKESIDRLHQEQPAMAFSSDFIVGYPGETDADFEATCDLVQHVGYAQAYSFKYSPRPGTPAAIDERQVPEPVKMSRLAHLQKLLSQQQLTFNQSTHGTIQEALLDRPGRYEGQLIGRTPYMQSIFCTAPRELLDTLASLHVDAAHMHSLEGSLVHTAKEQRTVVNRV